MAIVLMFMAYDGVHGGKNPDTWAENPTAATA